MTTDTQAEHVLVVDDEPTVRDSVVRGLWKRGFRCLAAENGQAALALLQKGRFAIMLSDIRMPGMDGLELLPRALAVDADLHVIMVTALAGIDTALGAMRCGAYDYLTKPFQLDEVELAIRRALDHRRLVRANREHMMQLEQLVERRTRQYRAIAVDVVTSLGLALEAKDEWTHDHSRRVGEVAACLGDELGLGSDSCADLRLAGQLHDIGKIGVRESVLLKADVLTAAEFDHIKLHPELGARILSPLTDLQPVLPFIRHHHERWDGAGYPDHLAGEAIPYGARILGVADAYVAMREDRPYRAGMLKQRVIDEVRSGAGRQFDRHIAGALLALDAKHVLEDLDHEFPEELSVINAA